MKERDLTLDLMKGLAIFLVVFGHVSRVTYGPDQFPLRPLVFSLHMPLFFFVSGYLSARKLECIYDIKRFFLKKCKLLLPLLMFGIIDIVIYDGKWAQWDSFLNWGKFGLWFFFVLFCFNVTYALCQYILRGNKNNFLEIAVLIAPAFIGILLRKFQHTGLGETLNFINAYNYSFFVMGIILKRYHLESFVRRNDIGLLFLGIYAIGLYTGNPILNIPMKAAGVLLVYSMLKNMVDRQSLTNAKAGGVLAEMGKNSLYIYVLHYYLLRTLDVLPKELWMFVYSSAVYHIMFMSLVAIFIIALSIIGAKVLCTNDYIRNYVFGATS